MSLFFYFIMVFGATGTLEIVTASQIFQSIESCNAHRDYEFHIKPVEESSRRIVTHCAQVDLTSLPRCR